MIAWTGWTQTRTAAFIPLAVLGGRTARATAARQRRACSSASRSPACCSAGSRRSPGTRSTGAGIYFLMRVLAEYRTHWKRVTAVVAGGVAAIGAARRTRRGAAAPLLLLHVARLRLRAATRHPQDVVPFRALITAIAPWALGSTDPLRPPAWFAGTNLVEAVSYVGAAALLLALVAVAAVRTGPRAAAARRLDLPRRRHRRLRRPHLRRRAAARRSRSSCPSCSPTTSSAGCAPSSASSSPSSPRSGSTCCCAGCARPTRQGLLQRLWGPAVWVGATVGTVGPLVRRPHARRQRPRPGRELRPAGPHRARLRRRGRRLRRARVVGPRPRRQDRRARRDPAADRHAGAHLRRPLLGAQRPGHLLPDTDVHRYLAEHLGDGRYASPTDTLLPGESSIHQLRSLGGHAFSDKRMGELVEGLPGNQFKDPPTLPSIAENPAVVGSPILDRLAVRYYVSAPWAPVIGTPHDLADGRHHHARPEQPGHRAGPAERPAPRDRRPRRQPDHEGHHARGQPAEPRRASRSRPAPATYAPPATPSTCRSRSPARTSRPAPR